MELYPMDVGMFMSQCHYMAFSAFGGDFKAIGETVSVNNPRVVSSNKNIVTQSLEKIVLFNNAGCCLYTVKHLGKIGEFSPENLADGLMSQTDTQNWFLSLIYFNHLFEQSGQCGNSRSRRKYNFVERCW